MTEAAYDNVDFSDDIRVQELQSCKAIYPNCTMNFSKYTGSIEIPLKNEDGIILRLLPESHRDTPLLTHKVCNLPSLLFTFELPERYPYEESLNFNLTSSILHQTVVDSMIVHLEQIWESYQDQVLFSMIDYLHDQTQNEWDLLIGPKYDVTSGQEFQTIVDYDNDIKQQEYETKTFTCEVCQEDYKGVNCLRFDSCGHTFCNTCLFAYFSSVIRTGEIDKVHCPSYECTKKFVKTKDEYSKLESWLMSDTRVEEIVRTLLTPAVPLNFLSKILTSVQSNESGEKTSEDLVNRYYTLFKKSQYEFIGKLLPNRLVKCPRIGCDEAIFREDLTERLVVCPRCAYAFCNDCHNSYHARFKVCKKVTSESGDYLGVEVKDIEAYMSLPRDSYERKTLNARYGRQRIIRAVEEYQMDLLFNKMLKESNEVKECPGCGIIIEKSDGCNKVKCSQCGTNMCFLCGEMLENNYDHFVSEDSSCYRKLFFGMPGAEEES